MLLERLLERVGGDCDSFCLGGDCAFKGPDGGVELKVSMVPVVGERDVSYWTGVIEAIVAVEKPILCKRDWRGDDWTAFFFNLPNLLLLSPDETPPK